MNTAFGIDITVDRSMSLLQEKAERLRGLHAAGAPILVLPNAWDAASAKVFENAGFPALSTTSAGIAAAAGYPDGEKIGSREMLEAICRIARTVDVPVTADLESGYVATRDAMRSISRQLIEAGAAGFNLADGLSGEPLPMEQTSHQVEKIRTVRDISRTLGVELVINARTDVYLHGSCEVAKNRFCHAVHRGNAYLDAGADCVFVPGVSDLETITELVRKIHGPVNVLAVAGTPSIAELAAAGVARVSLGSGPLRATLGLLDRIAKELRDRGTFYSFTNTAISTGDLSRMFE